MSSRILCCPSATEQRKTLLDIPKGAGHMGFCTYDQTLTAMTQHGWGDALYIIDNTSINK